MKKIIVCFVLALGLGAFGWHGTAAAENVRLNVTAGSGGNTCSPTAVGSFKPSALSVKAGDNVTVAFTVPANDPYDGGIEIRGFPNGTFTVNRGGIGSTSFIASTGFGFSSWWPGTDCHKADGTVTVAGAPTAPSSTTTPSQSSSQPAEKPAPSTALPSTGGLGISWLLIVGAGLAGTILAELRQRLRGRTVP